MRDERNCPKARRDGGEPFITGVPDCAVLRIPAWFWEARETAARMRIAGVPAVDRPYDSVILAEIVQGAIERAQHERLKAKLDLEEKEATHQARADEAVRRATGR